jgi:hypothetical protein
VWAKKPNVLKDDVMVQGWGLIPALDSYSEAAIRNGDEAAENDGRTRTMGRDKNPVNNRKR